jgi:hypothetical protein
MRGGGEGDAGRKHGDEGEEISHKFQLAILSAILRMAKFV